MARGVACTPEQVLITGGFQGALGLLAHTLLGPGEAAWVEDPGYPDARDALRFAGARNVGVPVDREGFDVERALTLDPRARLAVVTPTHQYPLGVTLSLSRRMALLEWAKAAEAWIIEDDYNSEFRYVGKLLPPLKSLDQHDRVLYIGTFSTVLAPGLRVGYMVVPSGLVGRLREAARLLQPPPGVLMQATIAAFLAGGHLARHVRRMRQLYAERRTALARALYASGHPLKIDVQPGGMHLLARLPHGTDDVALVARRRPSGPKQDAPGPRHGSALRAEPREPGCLPRPLARGCRQAALKRL